MTDCMKTDRIFEEETGSLMQQLRATEMVTPAAAPRAPKETTMQRLVRERKERANQAARQ